MTPTVSKSKRSQWEVNMDWVDVSSDNTITLTVSNSQQNMIFLVITYSHQIRR